MSEDFPHCIETKVFLMDVSPLEDPAVFQRFYDVMPQERRTKIDSYRFMHDRMLSLGAGILLDLCLKRSIGEYDQDSLRTDGKGKPFLAGSDIRFNLSHSGHMAMCIVSDTDVGCDIQSVDPVDTGIAGRVFTRKEVNNLKETEPRERPGSFYRLWTVKESLLKAIGTGLSSGMNSFEVSLDDTRHVVEYQGARYCITEIVTAAGYKAACCRMGAVAPGEAETVDLLDLM